MSNVTLRTLSVSLPALGYAVDAGPVRLMSERTGGGAASTRGFLSPRRESPDSSGMVTFADIPPSSAFGVDQSYVLYVGGNRYRFVLPAGAATPPVDVVSLLAPTERGPVIISTTEPVSPSSGDVAFDTTGLSPGAYSPGMNIRLRMTSGIKSLEAVVEAADSTPGRSMHASNLSPEREVTTSPWAIPTSGIP